MTETYNILKQAQEDLKYVNRWNMKEFCIALFPDTYSLYCSAVDSDYHKTAIVENPHYQYLMVKWEHFDNNKMEFIWSCSYDKLELMAKAIDEMKGDEE